MSTLSGNVTVYWESVDNINCWFCQAIAWRKNVDSNHFHSFFEGCWHFGSMFSVYLRVSCIYFVVELLDVISSFKNVVGLFVYRFLLDSIFLFNIWFQFFTMHTSSIATKWLGSVYNHPTIQLLQWFLQTTTITISS